MNSGSYTVFWEVLSSRIGGGRVHIRITLGRVRPGRWEAYETDYARFVDDGTPIEGLEGRILARDAEDPDKGYSISFWESEEAMRAYESGPLRDLLPRLEGHFAGEFSTHHCEVRRRREAD